MLDDFFHRVLCEASAEAGRLDEAREELSKVANPEQRHFALCAIAQAQIAADDLAGAAQTIDGLPKSSSSYYVTRAAMNRPLTLLLMLAEAYARKGDTASQSAWRAKTAKRVPGSAYYRRGSAIWTGLYRPQASLWPKFSRRERTGRYTSNRPGLWRIHSSMRSTRYTKRVRPPLSVAGNS